MSCGIGGGTIAIAALREAALTALRRRDLGAAAAAVEQLAALRATSTAGDAGAHAELGDLWSALADYTAAEQSYTRAIALAPGEPRLWFNRAAVRRFLGRIEAAEADYDRVIADYSEAIRLDPKYADPYFIPGRLSLARSH